MPNNNQNLPPCKWAQKLAAGTTQLGLVNMYPAAGIIEGMCRGWDFLWIDSQHGSHDYHSITNSIRAAEMLGLDTIVRPPCHDAGFLLRLCDLAPSALMVPMVNTPAEADAIARAMMFPPHGNRSFGGRRVIDMYGRDYYKDMRVGFIAQIETLEAVANIDAIANTVGVDALFFGPDDMKVQMGLSPATSILENPRTRDALKRTADAARNAGKLAGCVAVAKEDLAGMIDLGYSFLVNGGDAVFIRKLAPEALKICRETIAGKSAAAPGGGAKSLYAP